jgi:hypothetical protein
MNNYRAVFTTPDTGYTHQSFHSKYYDLQPQESLRLFYIPADHDTFIPCMLFHSADFALNKICIYFHGVNDDLGKLQDEARDVGRTIQMNVVTVEYPGYGLNFRRGITTAEEIKA